MRTLNQSVFDGQPPEVTLACVDYDGLLKFGKNVRNYRYTWASERWRGADWVEQREGTDYEPLTSIRRDTPNAPAEARRSRSLQPDVGQGESKHD